MKLQEYIDTCVARIHTFGVQWVVDNEKMEKMFPMELSETEWEEAETLSRDNE
jgi:hypothetical protein